LEAELRAFMEGVVLAKEWSEEPILVETDNIEVIQMTGSKERDMSELEQLVAEAKDLIIQIG
jgi:uncharacterized protein